MEFKPVTVFGGSGFLGRRIVERLAAEGTSVRVAVRHPERASFLERLGRDGQIELVRADVWDEPTAALLTLYDSHSFHRSTVRPKPVGHDRSRSAVTLRH